MFASGQITISLRVNGTTSDVCIEMSIALRDIIRILPEFKLTVKIILKSQNAIGSACMHKT